MSGAKRRRGGAARKDTYRAALEEDPMAPRMRWLATGTLAGVIGLSWGANIDRDVVGAQGRKPTMMKRVYTGTDGLSHVQEIELNANSIMEKVTGMRVNVSQPGSFSDWHVGPERRYIINLTGGGQIQVAEGKVDLPAGSIEFIDDLTGKGHTTANVGKEERVSVWLSFEDQKQIIGPLEK